MKNLNVANEPHLTTILIKLTLNLKWNRFRYFVNRNILSILLSGHKNII